uniref:Uncharacterized protein n=1 Tax=Romanomermis culicivorax TaxID=13658 RepID=A0A915I4V7_ROMCU
MDEEDIELNCGSAKTITAFKFLHSLERFLTFGLDLNAFTMASHAEFFACTDFESVWGLFFGSIRLDAQSIDFDNDLDPAQMQMVLIKNLETTSHKS